MNSLEPSYLVKPYPLAQLGGRVGLTSVDIAKMLGISHLHFVRDLKSRHYIKFLENAGFEFIQFGVKGSRGRPGTAFAFDVDASKAVVATSRTELGAGLLRFLIACERAMREDVPKLIAEVADLREKLKAVAKPRRVPGPGRRHRVLAGFRIERGIFGDEQVAVFRDMTLEEMTDDERFHYEAQHLAKISSGASKKAAQLINREVKPGKRSGQKRAALVAKASP